MENSEKAFILSPTGNVLKELIESVNERNPNKNNGVKINLINGYDKKHNKLAWKCVVVSEDEVLAVGIASNMGESIINAAKHYLGTPSKSDVLMSTLIDIERSMLRISGQTKKWNKRK